MFNGLIGNRSIGIMAGVAETPATEIMEAKIARLEAHTSFFIIKEDNGLCYGLGLDFVRQDFPFQSIREKSFRRETRGWQTLVFAVSFFVTLRAR